MHTAPRRGREGIQNLLMSEKKPELIVVGGGLAGSEAAWQAAQCGIHVVLYEMRPKVETGAHTSPYLAELVCSNSLGSILPDRASGLLKTELRRMESLLLRLAEEAAVPAGGALAVDRLAFSQKVTQTLRDHPNIELICEEMLEIPSTPAVIASGPLTSASLSRSIGELTGQEHLYFFDAIAPIVEVNSINLDIAYRASRYQTDEADGGDYINCPLNREEYAAFVDALLQQNGSS